MRLPVIASTNAFRPWSVGVALAIGLVCLPFATVFLQFVYAAALIATGVAVWSSARSARS